MPHHYAWIPDVTKTLEVDLSPHAQINTKCVTGNFYYGVDGILPQDTREHHAWQTIQSKNCL